MKKLFYLLILLSSGSTSYAQALSIQGALYDSLISKPIPFGSIALLKSDSSLVTSKRSSSKGQFSFTGLENDNYILLVEHPKYVTHTRNLQLTTNQTLKKVFLFQKKQLLKKVVIKDKKAIIIKGDTVSFAADSFATRDGDVVEDLLKLLPGMQVDESGNITSQGKKVEKVLVNGEEFFGTDPTIATQNLPSKAVEKVEVYDAKDAQEQFTGFSTEKDTKVINLKLKKEMSKGFFGKAASAAGPNDRWKQSIMLNKFNDKEQLGGYYLSNSNGMANMGWQDGNDYGAAATGGNSFSWNPFGSSAQNGITKSWKTGGRYINKYEKNNQELNVSYGNARFKRERSSRSYTENLLPENTFYKSDTNQSIRFNMKHALNARYKTDIDSFLRLDYSIRTSVDKSNNFSSASYYNKNENDSLISFNNRNAETEGINTNVSNNLNLNRKFRKKGRTLSLRATHSFQSNNSDRFTQSNNALNLLNDAENIALDQKRKVKNRTRSIGTNLVFTEPLSKKLRLKLSYEFDDDKNSNQSITSDTAGYSDGTYSNQIDDLSNIFTSRQISHTPGFVLRYESKKWKYTLGSDINVSQFEQFDFIRSNDFSYRQTNYIPRAWLQYKFSKYQKISMGYRGYTTTPRPNQLQPFQDNTNPLSVIVGNPNLKMGYNQNLSINYHSRSRLDGNYFNISTNFGNRINRIGTNRIFDETGRTTTTYINLPNSYNANLWSYLRKKVKGSWYLGLRVNGNYDHTPNKINNIDGLNENISGRINPSLTYNNRDLLYFKLSLSTAVTRNQNKGNLERTVSYISYSPSFTLNLYLPQFVSINNNIEYNYQPAVAPFNTPFTRALMTSSISKQLLPKKNLALKFEIFDVFNQNKGYTRRNDINYNTEQFYLTLGRYWMIGATWNFFSGPMATKRQGAKEKGLSGKAWLSKKKRAKVKDKKSSTPSGGGEQIIIIGG